MKKLFLLTFSHQTHRFPSEQHTAPSLVNDDHDDDGPCLTFASASGISIVSTRAFRNALAIMQHCLLSTGKASGTIGATTFTGLVTS